MTKDSSFFIFSAVDFLCNALSCFEASEAMQRTSMFRS